MRVTAGVKRRRLIDHSDCDIAFSNHNYHCFMSGGRDPID